MANINTQENWNKYHKKVGTLLNYPDKFKFISSLLDKPFAKVLEIGCGMGILMSQIKNDHPSYLIEGIDFSEVSVNHINNSGMKASVGILPQCLSNYSGYDYVIGTEILEHLEEQDRKKVISEVYRILKPKGKAIFSVPNRVLPPSEEPFHLTCFNKKTFYKLLSPFDLIGIIEKEFLPSDNPNPNNKLWGRCPFLIGVAYRA